MRFGSGKCFWLEQILFKFIYEALGFGSSNIQWNEQFFVQISNEMNWLNFKYPIGLVSPPNKRRSFYLSYIIPLRNYQVFVTYYSSK
jgi:hypothetical protein